MNRKKTVWFYLVLAAAGSVALLTGCDAVSEIFGWGEEEKESVFVNPPVGGFDPSIPSFYVSSAGSDTKNVGTNEAAPLATLAAAYERVLTDGTRKRIVVLSNLSEAGLVTLPPNGKTVGGGGGFVLIEGKHAGLKIQRSTGANDSVLRIQDGAKIAFKNITVNGKIAPEDNGENANNRAILIAGPGTEVLFGTGVVATGKMYYATADGSGNVDADEHGSGIRVNNGGKLVMTADSAVTGCVGVGLANGSIHLDGGFLEMKDGSRVYGNTVRYGGGVQAYNSSAFAMYGGEISGNKATEGGGGVHLQHNSVFTMLGGVISGNEAADFGGGIGTGSGCTVTLKDGKISGNHSGKGGGGIEVFKTTFIMEGGEISGNTTSGDGGGVYLSNNAESKFTMTGGVVYGADVPVPQANTVGQNKTGAALYKSADAVIEDTTGVTGTMDTTINKR
jgi:hypothetical protein